MKSILQEFMIEIITGGIGIILLTFKDFLKKNLSKFYMYIIQSRFTPKRLKAGEEKAMKLGVTTGIISAKEKAYASNIYLFSIRKNGRDTLLQHLKADDVSELDSLDTEGFEKIFEALKNDKFLVIENTDQPKTEDWRVFCDVLQSVGYKSVNLLLIENKYRFAFFMVVHRDNRLTSEDDIELLKKNLLQWTDPIVTLYLKTKKS